MKLPRIEWQPVKLCMDTHSEKEGLHIYMIRHGIQYNEDGTIENVTESLSEHVDRKRAREIRDDINRRLF